MVNEHVLRNTFTTFAKSIEILTPNAKWELGAEMSPMAGFPSLWIIFGTKTYGSESFFELGLFASKEHAAADKDHLLIITHEHSAESGEIGFDWPYCEDISPLGPIPLALATLIFEIKNQGGVEVPQKSE